MKKELAHVYVTYKQPYVNWVRDASEDITEQNALAWDETRKLMQRLMLLKGNSNGKDRESKH